jgi:hypothetical protein
MSGTQEATMARTAMMMGTKVRSSATATVALIWLLSTTVACSTSPGTLAAATGTDAGTPGAGPDAIGDGGDSPDTTSQAGADAPDASPDDGPEGLPDGAPPALPDGSAEVGESGGTSVCARLCATILARACPSDDLASCVASCESLLASQPCGPVYGDLADCQADRPVTDFVCDTGKAVLADGLCVTEGQLLADCLLF